MRRFHSKTWNGRTIKVEREKIYCGKCFRLRRGGVSIEPTRKRRRKVSRISFGEQKFSFRSSRHVCVVVPFQNQTSQWFFIQFNRNKSIRAAVASNFSIWEVREAQNSFSSSSHRPNLNSGSESKHKTLCALFGWKDQPFLEISFLSVWTLVSSLSRKLLSLDVWRAWKINENFRFPLRAEKGNFEIKAREDYFLSK